MAYHCPFSVVCDMEHHEAESLVFKGVKLSKVYKHIHKASWPVCQAEAQPYQKR